MERRGRPTSHDPQGQVLGGDQVSLHLSESSHDSVHTTLVSHRRLEWLTHLQKTCSRFLKGPSPLSDPRWEEKVRGCVGGKGKVCQDGVSHLLTCTSLLRDPVFRSNNVVKTGDVSRAVCHPRGTHDPWGTRRGHRARPVSDNPSDQEESQTQVHPLPGGRHTDGTVGVSRRLVSPATGRVNLDSGGLGSRRRLMCPDRGGRVLSLRTH